MLPEAGSAAVTGGRLHPQRDAGVLADQPIISIVEASTTMREVNHDRARTAIGANGDPLILWVGRLTSNNQVRPAPKPLAMPWVLAVPAKVVNV